jgi:hypothetical protein
MSDEVLSRVVYYDTVKDIQVRLGVNEFRGVEYLFLRKYYRDFEGDWKPSTEGVNMPLGIENSKEMFAGLLEILSLAESKQLIVEHFKELLEATYTQ